ncbi:MAG TPA: YdcF family protein [Acetobacteraceae bacterium]
MRPGADDASGPLPAQAADGGRHDPSRGPQGKIAIVIFGAAVRPDGRPSGTLECRVRSAVAFASGRIPDPIFVPTGGVGLFGPSEASVMRNMLIAAGFPSNRVLSEETGTDTLSSVRAVTRLLRSRSDVRAVYAATSAYHLPRCLLLLRIAGVHARPLAATPSAVTTWGRWYWRLREVPAIPYDAMILTVLRLCGRL